MREYGNQREKNNKKIYNSIKCPRPEGHEFQDWKGPSSIYHSG